MILQTVLFQHLSAKMIYNQAKVESENSLQNMQNEIYTFVKGIETNLIEIYSESELLKDLREEQNVDELKKKYYRTACDIATGKFETEDGVVAMYLYTIDHEIISTYRRAVTPKHNYMENIYDDVNYTNAQQVREYVESDDAIMCISSYYNKYREKDMIRFVLKLYNKSNQKEKIGYIVCDIDGKVIEKIMEKYCTENMIMWIQPMEDRPAITVGKITNDENQYYAEAVEKIINGENISLSENLQQELFQVEQNKYDLNAYSLMPQELLKENQKTLTTNLIATALMTVILAVLLSFLISKIMTKPLNNLMLIIERIKAGEKDIRTKFKGRDEIGQLGQSFDEMLDQMDELKEKEYQMRQLADQAEYKALQAQINPHFLYNTLDTMSSIADTRGCAEVSRLSQSLANIFRYTLNMSSQLTTISKELIHLKNYAYVMNVRMQDEIHYTFHIEPNVQQELIPRLSLQPLVENAINHGLKNKRGEKEIQIDIRMDEEKFHICVMDNGVGMDADAMNKILQKNEISYVEKGKSIGLMNINARIKMLYGEEYGLYVESRENEGTKVHMLLQRRGDNEE